MKKRLPLIIALIAAISLFSITALAFSSDKTGYDTLKDVMKSAKHFDNGTFDLKVAVTDNEKAILNATVTGKADSATKNASGEFSLQANGVTKSAAFYQQGEECIFVDLDNDLYYKMNPKDQDQACGRHHRSDYKNGNMEMTSAQEALVDFLAGDLKNQVNLLENADGTKTISLDLDHKDIPAVLNLMVSAAASSEDHPGRMNKDMDNSHDFMKEMPFFAGFENLDQEMPVLKEEVKVQALVVNLTVDANDQVVAFDFSTTLSGKDANGVDHTVTVNSSGVSSDLNNTTVDSFDLTGKDVIVIDSEKYNQ